jgi:hypothetical protein
VKLKFLWRSPHSKECYIALCDAVRLGYNTKEALLAVLPQFSVNRLVMGLENLISASMAHVNIGTLSIDPDMQIVEALVAGRALSLPLDAEEFVRNDPLLIKILMTIGVQNAAGALTLLKPKIEEVKDDI